jgi:uncharacterized protein
MADRIATEAGCPARLALVAFQIELLDGVAAVPRETWNALVADASPFLEWEWLASLEDAGCVGPGTSWQPRPLILREAGRIAAACPLYVKLDSEGEFVFDWSWADAAQRAGIRYYPKLLVGVPFTPVSGARFLTGDAEPARRAEWIGALGAALREICDSASLSSAHINFCREDEARALERIGFMRRVGVQYHWRNEGYRDFEEYLSRLRSKRRNQIRRERRCVAAQGIATEMVRGDALDDALFEPMFRCYAATVDAHYYGRRYLNLRFFELLRERFRHRLCFAVARQHGELIAGTTNVTKGDALYGRYWGALRPARDLHFEACYYTAIEHCIALGLARFEPGAGGDYKFLRGFDAQPTLSVHSLRQPDLAQAVARFLEAERSDAQQALHALAAQSALKQADA